MVLLMLAWAALLVVLLFAVLTVPRWCFRSAVRYHLWNLRDALVDNILDEQLPPHPAVMDTLKDIEVGIRHVAKMRLAEAVIFFWLASGLSEEAEAALHRVPVSMEGLNEQQQETLVYYRERWQGLMAQSLISGSWFGVFFIVTHFFRRRRAGAVGTRLRQAVEATAQSPLGDRTRDAARVAASRYREKEAAVSHS